MTDDDEREWRKNTADYAIRQVREDLVANTQEVLDNRGIGFIACPFCQEHGDFILYSLSADSPLLHITCTCREIGVTTTKEDENTHA